MPLVLLYTELVDSREHFIKCGTSVPVILIKRKDTYSPNSGVPLPPLADTALTVFMLSALDVIREPFIN